MKRTVAKVTHQGTYRVIYDDSRLYEKYTIYQETYSDGSKHSKLLERYGDLTSCLFHIGDRIIEGENA